MRLDPRSVFVEMARKELDVKMLCSKAGVSKVTFHRIMNHKQKPMPITIGKIARALNVPVESIIRED